MVESRLEKLETKVNTLARQYVLGKHYFRKIAREEALKAIAEAADPMPGREEDLDAINSVYAKHFIPVKCLTRWLESEMRKVADDASLSTGSWQWGVYHALVAVKDFILEEE